MTGFDRLCGEMCADGHEDTNECGQTDRQIDRQKVDFYVFMRAHVCVCVSADVRPGCVFLQWQR